MKKELKNQIIESISAALQQYPNFYLTNIEGLNAEQTVKLRRACFDEGIKLNVVKNTLFAHVIKGMENEELQQLVPVLEGNTAIMYTESPNGPAKLIKKLQKDLGGKPLRYQVQGRAHRRHHLPPPGSYAQCHLRSPEWWRPDNRRTRQDSLGKRRKVITIINLKIINYGRCKSTCRRVG